MCSRPMIIGNVRGQETSQMPLAEDDHVVQTLAPNGSDQSLRIRILPRAGRGRYDFGDPHAGDAAPEHIPVDGIAIPQQPSRRGVVRKGLDDLLRPCRHSPAACCSCSCYSPTTAAESSTWRSPNIVKKSIDARDVT